MSIERIYNKKNRRFTALKYRLNGVFNVSNKEIQKVYSSNFKVRSYEVDTTGKATISSICNYFQEAAGLHAKHLAFDISDLLEKGMTWILYKMHIKIDHFPNRWDEIDVITWPSSGDGLRAFRDYKLCDKDGSLMGVGLSQWMILNVKNKRPVRLPKEIMDMGLETNDHIMKIDKKPIKSLEGENGVYITKVGRSDLDMNNHVNNVKYVDWVTGYGAETGQRCTEVDIQYYSESNLGDHIVLATNKFENDNKTCTLFKGDSKEVIASANTKWEKALMLV